MLTSCYAAVQRQLLSNSPLTATGERCYHCQSKVLRLIVDAHWYVSISVIRNDIKIPTVKEEISRFSSHYNVRISVHPNELITSLTEPPASILAPRPACQIIATCINQILEDLRTQHSILVLDFIVHLSHFYPTCINCSSCL
jgi:hypothetical protein